MIATGIGIVAIAIVALLTDVYDPIAAGCQGTVVTTGVIIAVVAVIT